MSDILIKSVSELHGAIDALRQQNELKSAESKGVVEKIQSALDEHEVKNQNLLKKLEQKDNQIKEIEERLISLTSASNYNVKSESNQQEIKNYEKFFVNGRADIDQKYLRTDNAVAGGFLVPAVQLNEIIKNIVEISNLRPFARVRTMGGKTESMPVRSNNAVAYMTGEAQSSTASKPVYGERNLEARKMTFEYSVSYELLQDSAFDVIAEMNSEAAEQFALLEGQQFVNGSGAGNNMSGFMQDAAIGFINSGDANAVTFDSLIKVTGEIKTGYNPIYAFNRRTLAVLRTLKDASNRYIWESGNLGAGVPSSINGVPYAIMPDMPDIAAGTFPIIFGDFKNYVIGDRKGLTVVRDDYTLQSSGLIKFVMHRRVGGIVAKPEAFKKIKIAVNS
jgi:HK97 family phage major capsid protein